MKTLYWALLLVSVFFAAWFSVDHVSIYLVNHGIFSTVIGNWLMPVLGTRADNWLVWFAILFGWLGFIGIYYSQRRLRGLPFWTAKTAAV